MIKERHSEDEVAEIEGDYRGSVHMSLADMVEFSATFVETHTHKV